MNDNQPATKADLAAVKTELKEDFKRIAIEVVKLQSGVEDINERMATKDDINRIMGAIDAFAAEAQSYRNHDTLRGRAIMAHDEKLTNHENRITLLEAEK